MDLNWSRHIVLHTRVDALEFARAVKDAHLVADVMVVDDGTVG